MTVITYEQQRTWMVNKAKGAMADALLRRDDDRYVRAHEVVLAAERMSAEQFCRLPLDYSCSMQDGTRIALS